MYDPDSHSILLIGWDANFIPVLQYIIVSGLSDSARLLTIEKVIIVLAGSHLIVQYSKEVQD